MEYLSFNKYLKDKFGQKVYKISLDGGFTCPNRDGKIDFVQKAEVVILHKTEI